MLKVVLDMSNTAKTTESSSNFSCTTENGIISWNTDTMYQTANNLDAVANRMHEAHNQLLVLVPRIKAYWQSSEASVAYMDKLDNGLVKHFETACESIKTLASILRNDIAGRYELCEKRIENADYDNVVTKSSSSNTKLDDYTKKGFTGT